MKNVLYHFLNHKKINGTLFYCFEYFLKSRELDENILFHIHNISDTDLEMVKDVFRERYIFDESVLHDVQSLNSSKDIFNIQSDKTLILDVHTFNRTYMFIRHEILCFSNEAHPMIRSDHKKITYYGFYDYQSFDVSSMLKLNFERFRPVTKSGNKVLVSSRLFNYREITLPEELKGKEVITKAESSHRRNLFDSFDTLYYYHSDFDTNNRLIPECYFYGKKLIVHFNDKFNDSVRRRYEDIQVNGLRNYTLDNNDRIIKDFVA